MAGAKARNARSGSEQRFEKALATRSDVTRAASRCYGKKERRPVSGAIGNKKPFTRTDDCVAQLLQSPVRFITAPSACQLWKRRAARDLESRRPTLADRPKKRMERDNEWLANYCGGND